MTKGGIASLLFFILIKMVKYLPSTFDIHHSTFAQKIYFALSACGHAQAGTKSTKFATNENT